MAIFKNSFRDYVKEELESRRSFENRQKVFVPNARVTALISSPNFKGEPLHGFTLGAPDTSLVQSLSQLVNTSGQGTTVGITYTNREGDSPVPVVIPTKNNLPSPAVTNIVISTQSRGGLIFKATVDMKFYGKEQYDFIYQTFMRPGNPIVIEYGHGESTRGPTFFKELTPRQLNQYTQDLYQLKPLEKSRDGGRVVGLVSNFSIKLNEANEYEAQIELINALEFMFTLAPEDTFISYREDELSQSITNIFGYIKDDEYNPELDQMFQHILVDLGTAHPINREILNGRDATSPAGELGETIYSSINKDVDYFFVSLHYIMNRLLTLVLDEISLTKESINSNVIPVADIEIGPIGNWDTLRSINVQNVLINNANLYSDTPPEDNETLTKTIPIRFRSKEREYREQFSVSDVAKLFRVRYDWKIQKNTYGNEPEGESTGRGIFVNYKLVRNSFIGSTSISEAIIRILNSINSATSGVLDLKLRMKEEDDVFVMSIYDQNILPSEPENDTLYSFFKDNISEAISYDFDFSLPSTVASTIVANNFISGDRVVGDASAEQLIKNGYDDRIQSLIDQNFEKERIRSLKQSKPLEVSTDDDDGLELEEDKLFSRLLGYKELIPPSMKSSIIKSGLFNVLPTAATVTIRLIGLDGFRFGDMFRINNMLPDPYDTNNVFYLTGYKHTINSDGWVTEIDGQMIAATPDNKNVVSQSPQSNTELNLILIDSLGN